MAPERTSRPGGNGLPGMRNSALATAALTSVALLSQTAGAVAAPGDDAPSRDEVQQRVNSLYDRAETDTGNYNATRAAAIPRQRGGAPASAGRRGAGPATDNDREPAAPALGDVARQWFDVARAKLGPTVPAALPADRMPPRPTRAPQARPSRPAEAPTNALALEGPKTADRAVPELTAGSASELTSRSVPALPSAPTPAQDAPGALSAASAASATDSESSPLRATKQRNQQKLTQARELLATHRSAQLGTQLTAIESRPAEGTWPAPAEAAPDQTGTHWQLVPQAADLIPDTSANPSYPQSAELPVTAAPTFTSPLPAGTAATPAPGLPADQTFTPSHGVPVLPVAGLPTTPASTPPHGVPMTPAPAYATNLATTPASTLTPGLPADPASTPSHGVPVTPAPGLPTAPAAMLTPGPVGLTFAPMPGPATAPGPAYDTNPPTAQATALTPGLPVEQTFTPSHGVPVLPVAGLPTAAAPAYATNPAATATFTPTPGTVSAPAPAYAAGPPAVQTFTAGLPVPPVAAYATAASAAPVPAPAPVASVPAAQAADAGYDLKAAKVVAFARAQIGRPCVWGAAGPGSYDAAGLTQASWKAAEVGLPRTAQGQATAGMAVPLDEVRAGDLIFFFDDLSHVGLFIGNGTMIHAPGPGAYIREESVFHAGEAAIRGAVRPA
ncbi:NlpC/P60 family protein [Streptomyces sp. NPDC005263]|uniref:C40 family peptidase n=1 Tax=Streptomyces sp. NPDC005263 TaxID=3364711 RepID=UPI0036B98E47